MMSQAISRFRLVGNGVALAAMALTVGRANAQADSTGDNWSVGAAAADDTSVGLAATVNVPAPAQAGSASATVQHSTAPSNLPPGAQRPAEQAPAYSQPTAAGEYEDTDPSALDAFRSDLDPYGRWIDDSKYGRVWVPDPGYVGSDFAPYVSNGRWGLDADNNWVWMSDYPFGWVVFHYGRWVWIDSVGWSWVPGRRYAPAWVVWRVPTDDYAYVGWAPAPPTYAWFGMYAYGLGYYPPLPFVFCPSYYMFYPHFGAYLVRDRYFASTLVHHSVWYSTAPVYGRGYASPTMSRARIPAGSVPSQRVSADPRAVSMSRPSANPSIGSRGSSARLNSTNITGGGNTRLSGAGLGARPYGMSPGAQRPSTTLGNGRFAGTYRSNSTAGGYSNFGNRPRPLVESSTPYSSGRQVRSLGSMPGASYSSPRYSAPSSFSSPRYSAPSSSYSAPRYSSPSSSFSAPSHSFSSGHSFSGGGGGFRGGGGGGFRSGGGRHR